MSKPTVWLATDLDQQVVGPWIHALRMTLALEGHLSIVHAHARDEANPWSKLPSPGEQLEDWGLDGALDVELVSLEGEPRDVLPEAFREGRPDWLVVGTHRPTGAKRFLSGSMGEYLARARGAVKTLVVPDGTRSFVVETTGRIDLPRILVPVGGEPDQQPAIDAAADLARIAGDAPVEIVVLHCGTDASLPQLTYPQHANWTWRQEIVDSEAVVGAILEAAVRWDAAAVVMHSHGHDSLSDSVWGSHAERVLRDTFVPLVVVWGG